MQVCISVPVKKNHAILSGTCFLIVINKIEKEAMWINAATFAAYKCIPTPTTSLHHSSTILRILYTKLYQFHLCNSYSFPIQVDNSRYLWKFRVYCKDVLSLKQTPTVLPAVYWLRQNCRLKAAATKRSKQWAYSLSITYTVVLLVHVLRVHALLVHVLLVHVLLVHVLLVRHMHMIQFHKRMLLYTRQSQYTIIRKEKSVTAGIHYIYKGLLCLFELPNFKNFTDTTDLI